MNPIQNQIEKMEAFKFRMRSITLPVIQLLNVHLEAIEQQLEHLKIKTPNLFQRSPMIIDVAALCEEHWQAYPNWPKIIELFRYYGVMPVGIQGASNLILEKIAEESEIAVFNADKVRNERLEKDASSVQREQKNTVLNEKRTYVGSSKIITKPIRSGQQVYAEGGDLIVLASVSTGAELLADGHIHVYGPLRGRALAGIQGNRDARIFCQALEADLLAIAGCYMTSETIDRYRKGGRQQVFLENERLMISDL